MRMKFTFKDFAHYIAITIVLFEYHFFIGMTILNIFSSGSTEGFILYSFAFLMVFIASDRLLHKVLGLK